MAASQQSSSSSSSFEVREGLLRTPPSLESSSSSLESGSLESSSTCRSNPRLRRGALPPDLGAPAVAAFTAFTAFIAFRVAFRVALIAMPSRALVVALSARPPRAPPCARGCFRAGSRPVHRHGGRHIFHWRRAATVAASTTALMIATATSAAGAADSAEWARLSRAAGGGASVGEGAAELTLGGACQGGKGGGCGGE